MAGYYIDAAMLRKRGACEWQVERFVQTFGEGRVLVNLANVKKAMGAGLDVTWPARGPWIAARWGGEPERAASRLYDLAYDAETPTQVLDCLKAAPRYWRMIDAERATGGHR
jgi:hypothetical protein